MAMISNSSIPSIVIKTAPTSCVLPDIPYSKNVDPDALSGLVKSVCDQWTAQIPEKKTLALFLPDDAIRAKISRENFIELLEHCEEVLDFKRVLVCFDKEDIDPRQGIPRMLKCIGFNTLHPDKYPPTVDKSNIFAMVYNI